MSELEKQFKEAAVDLSGELAIMHGKFLKLIIDLRTTELTAVQSSLISEAAYELGKSQGRFFAKYGDMFGGANPQNN